MWLVIFHCQIVMLHRCHVISRSSITTPDIANFQNSSPTLSYHLFVTYYKVLYVVLVANVLEVIIFV